MEKVANAVITTNPPSEKFQKNGRHTRMHHETTGDRETARLIRAYNASGITKIVPLKSQWGKRAKSTLAPAAIVRRSAKSGRMCRVRSRKRPINPKLRVRH